MIRFEDVHKAFGSKKVLNGLNLEIPPGSIFFILGRSGTGKSVALKHLVGLLKADRGKIELDGQEIQSLPEKAFSAIRRKCALVFQLPALIDSRNLFENLSFGIRHESFKRKFALIEKALIDVKLEGLFTDLLDKFPPQLSYGEQKRLALARTLVTNPQHILYDEPTTGLDPITARAIHELIGHVSRKLGKTSIVVSHDMHNALQTADQIVVMDAGRVVDAGSPADIRKSQVALTRDFLEALPL